VALVVAVVMTVVLNVSSTTEPIQRRVDSVVELTFNKSVVTRVCTVGCIGSVVELTFKTQVVKGMIPDLSQGYNSQPKFKS
jgi:hypothetical protein